MIARRNGRPPAGRAAPGTVRVAIYTRKSTDEGLDREFNSLDAQRQAVLAFIESQRGEGWVALPEHYDDGGFTGANTDRPAFQRLLADIDAGRIDAVAVYKLDRLSRSLSDFVTTVQFLEQRGVSFVSISQGFNTSTPTGRLLMHLLATFGQFERETIAERTADKIRASRRRGMWTGGRPVLGFDAKDRKLVVNKHEAALVREVFRLYLELGSLLQVTQELARRGERNKTLIAQNGRRFAGAPFDKDLLRRLLRNPLYVGRTALGDETFEGQHDAIVDQETWDAVQAQLDRCQRGGGKEHRNKWGALLRGIAKCGVCGSALGHTYTQAKQRLYRFYVCQTSRKRGAAACPGSRASAPELERIVVDRIRALGRDPKMLERVVKAMHTEAERRLPELTAELRRLQHEAQQARVQREQMVDAIAAAGPAAGVLAQRLQEVDERMERAATRQQELQAEIAAGHGEGVDVDHLRTALADFDPIWNALFPREQIRVLRLLIEEVRYDARTTEVAITFRPGGVQALATELQGASR